MVASVTGSTNIMCSCQVTQSIVMTTQVLQSIQCLGIVMLSCRVVMKILRGEDPSLTLWVFFFLLCDFRINTRTSILQKVKDVASVYVVLLRDGKSQTTF